MLFLLLLYFLFDVINLLIFIFLIMVDLELSFFEFERNELLI